MARKKRRTLTAKQIAAGFGGKKRQKAAKKSPTSTKRRKSRPLTDRKRKRLGYTKERTVATKKKRKGGKKSRRGGGRRGGLMSGIEWGDMAGAGAYGWLEKQAITANPGAGETAYLSKVPLFFPGIGFAGCSAILAHIVSKNVGGTVGKVARHYARGTFDVAAYKLMKNGGLYENEAAATAALAGDGDDDLSGDDEFEVGLDDDEVGYGADGIAGDDDD